MAPSETVFIAPPYNTFYIRIDNDRLALRKDTMIILLARGAALQIKNNGSNDGKHKIRNFAAHL